MDPVAGLAPSLMSATHKFPSRIIDATHLVEGVTFADYSSLPVLLFLLAFETSFHAGTFCAAAPCACGSSGFRAAD